MPFFGARLEGMHTFMSEMPENSFLPKRRMGDALDEQNVRWLTGWLDEAEALQVLSAGRYGAGPFPVPAELQMQVRAARGAVAGREPFEPRPTILPHAEGDAALGEVASRQDIQMAFADASWRPEYVDISKVIPVQKMVVTDGLHERVAGITKGSPELLELCLPAQHQPVLMDLTPDPDGRAVTITSLNPNLRVQGFEVNLGPVGGAVIFGVVAGLSYVTVVETGGRFFLRDGHHRAVALLAAGITAVPAIVVAGASYSDVATVPGLFGPQVCLTERPPLIADYLDEHVSAAGVRRRPRKVTRLSAAEFAV